MNRIIDMIKKVETREEVSTLLRELHLHENRIGDGLSFNILEHIEELIYSNRILYQVCVERYNGVDIDETVGEWVKTMAKSVDSVDRAYFSKEEISFDILYKHKTNIFDDIFMFDLFFRKDHIDEIVYFFGTPGLGISDSEEKPSLAAAMASYCKYKDVDIFGFIDMATEIMGYDGDDEGLIERAKRHTRLLRVDLIGQAVSLKKEITEVFKRSCFFCEDIFLSISFGKTDNHYFRIDKNLELHLSSFEEYTDSKAYDSGLELEHKNPKSDIILPE